MERKARIVLFFSLCTVFVFATVTSTSDSHTYQTLVLNSLPNPSTLSWTSFEAESNPTLSDITEPNGEFSLSLDLQHIDSLSLIETADSLSSKETPQSLFNKRLQRDSLRVKSISDLAASAARTAPRNSRGFNSSIVSGLAEGSGEYFTRLGVGTPPTYVYMVLDTGSDVIWLQCAPCKQCYSQTDPLFDPRMSRTYSSVSCDSPLCRGLDSPGCNQNQPCLYQVSYGDGSFTVGDLSTEMLTFRGNSVGPVALGCGHDNKGLFAAAAGLLGLGLGRLSFPTQAGRWFNNTFSYCLIDRSTSAKPSSMIFGNAAVPQTALFTPLLSNPSLDTFYYIELLGISVGGVPVPGITESMFKLDENGNGGVIIDSGTSVTRLTQPAYIALRDAFRVGTSSLKSAPEFSLFDTCYDLSGMTEVNVPTLVLNFRGANLSLPSNNYLIPVDSSGTFCFAFAGTLNALSIIGNIQQQGLQVVYDLAGSRIGFSPRGCV